MDEIERLIDAYGHAEFESGEWDRNESDEPYDDVADRAEQAKENLLSAIRAVLQEKDRELSRHYSSRFCENQPMRGEWHQ